MTWTGESGLDLCCDFVYISYLSIGLLQMVAAAHVWCGYTVGKATASAAWRFHLLSTTNPPSELALKLATTTSTSRKSQNTETHPAKFRHILEYPSWRKDITDCNSSVSYTSVFSGIHGCRGGSGRVPGARETGQEEPLEDRMVSPRSVLQHRP